MFCVCSSLRLLYLLEDTHIVNLVGCGQAALVDAHSTAPVTTPRKVELEVEGVEERPSVVVALAIIREGEVKLAIEVELQIILGPLYGVGVELRCGGRDMYLVGLLRADRVVVGLAVNRR